MHARDELPLNPAGSTARKPTSPFHIETYDANEVDLLVAAMCIGMEHALVCSEKGGWCSIVGVGAKEEPREFETHRMVPINLYDIMGLEELASGESEPFVESYYDDEDD